MTSKEMFTQIFGQFKNNNRLTLATYNQLLQALERLEQLEAENNSYKNIIDTDIKELQDLRNENKELRGQNFDLSISNVHLRNEIFYLKDKYQNAIEFLGEALGLEVDLDHNNLITDLGTISFISAKNETIKELERLKEVLGNE